MKENNKAANVIFAISLGAVGATLIYTKFAVNVLQGSKRILKKKTIYTKNFLQQEAIAFKNRHQENILKIKAELKEMAQTLEQM